MKELNLLFATTETNEKATEGLQQELTEELAKYSITVRNINQRNTKTAVMRYFESDSNDLDVFICQEFLDEQLFAEDFEKIIKKSKSGLLIIEIVGEEKGSQYLDKLLTHGIYNAVFPEDATIQSIAKRIAEPYSRKDALAYYGVVQKIGTNYSTSAEQLSQFISGYDGTIDDLRARVVQASSKASSEVFFEVLLILPDEILDKISRFENYKQIVNLAYTEKEKRKEISMLEQNVNSNDKRSASKKDKAEKKSKKKESNNESKKKKGKNKESASEMRLSSEKGFEIAFVSTNKGVGCTYSALLCAFSLKSLGYRTAIVEFDNKDQNFMDLSRQVLNRRDVDGIMSYDFGGVDFYLNMQFSNFRDNYRPKYDFVIYDFGCCSNEVIGQTVMNCERIFVVASPQEYKYAELMDFVNEVSPLDIHREFIYLFPLCDDEMLGNLLSLIGSERVGSVPLDRNPFCPAKETVELFEGFIENPSFANLSKKGLSIEERLSVSDRQNERKFTKKAIIGLSIACGLLFITAVGLQIFAVINSNKLKGTIAEMNEYIATCEDKLSASEETIASYDRTVLVLKAPVTLGSLITEDMYEEKTIKSDQPQDMYVSKEDISGKYAACNIEEGIPIYHYYIADMAEALPEEADAGGAAQ